MKSSVNKVNNAKVRVGYGLAGLTLWAWLAELAEKALAPYHSVFCLAGKELLLNVPLGRICEILASTLRDGPALASTPGVAWMASVVHVVIYTWR